MGQGDLRAEARSINSAEATLAAPWGRAPAAFSPLFTTPASTGRLDRFVRGVADFGPCGRIRSQRMLEDFREVWLSDYSH